ncbi:XdhC family protein [Cohnella caldifontis]|uniref:XdhC family protein n=1 Tax=Cohnella caldifontis TaxID=3027471 RepID=UPI0023EE0BDE|nr:XdhC/CoxI family protein [Cohnella sp. YIM B05605]
MTSLYGLLDAIGRSDGPFVLATIIRTYGSAYRKAGAAMLFGRDGVRLGMLSGGCLEEDLATRANELVGSERSHTVVYDMRSDDTRIWGIDSGCNGLVEVLLEPVHPRLKAHLRMAKVCLDRGIPVTCLRRLDRERSVTGYYFAPHDGQSAFGDWTGDVPDSLRMRQAGEGLTGDMFILQREPAEVFAQTLWPKPRLILFGAGEDARPVAALAAKAGYSVTVADWRPAYCAETFFPDADRLLVGSPTEIQRQLRLGRQDSAVLMSHHFDRDREMLRYLLRHELKYVGILGPRHRTVRLLDGKPVPESVRSPAGLPIGAEGPEEIAVSIVGELIRTFRGRPAAEGQ